MGAFLCCNKPYNMNLMIFIFLIGIAAVLGLRIFLRKPLVQLANHASRVAFDSIVPTYGSTDEEDSDTFEMSLTFDQEWERTKPVLVEEADTVLLLEAEKLIADVELIASSQHEVLDRLHAVIPGYMLLYKTKYYEAINEFISLTLKRECDMAVDEKQLAALWQ